MTRLAVISAAIISFFVLTSVASAQYPPPEDTVVTYVTDSTPPTGSVVVIGFRVQELSAAAGFGGGSSCQASIVSQPGDDAFLITLPVFNAGGVAILYTGSTPGPIVVSIVCGEASSEVTVMVESSPLSISAPAEMNDLSGGGQPDASSTNGGSGAGSQALLLSAVAVLGLAGIGGAGRFLLTRKR